MNYQTAVLLIGGVLVVGILLIAALAIVRMGKDGGKKQ